MGETVFLKKVTRVISLLASMLVITATAIIYIKKDIITDIDSYRPKIDNYISSMFGNRTKIASITGEWNRLAPQISIKKISMLDSKNDQALVTLNDISLHINLIQSIFSRELVSRELSIGQMNILIQETKQGSWSIAGRDLGGKDTGVLRNIFNNRYIEIKSINATFNFLSGVKSTLRLQNTNLENKANFHRLTSNVYLEKNKDPVDFIIEAKGRGQNVANFDILAYLKLYYIDINAPLKKILRGFSPNIDKKIIELEAAMSGDIWLSAKRNENYRLYSNLQLYDVKHSNFKGGGQIQKVDTDIYGWYSSGRDMGLRFENLNFTWDDIRVQSTSIGASKKMHEEKILLSLDKVDLTLLSDISQKIDVIPKNITDLVGKIKPSGMLHNLYLEFTDQNIDHDFRLRANIEDAATHSWDGKPGFRKINGYIDIKSTSGLIELDSPNGFGFQLPDIFDEYIYRSSIKGNISWRYNNKNGALKIFSGLIKMDGVEGNSRSYFYMDIPDISSGLDPQLYLTMGIKNLNARFKESYIPNNLDKRLTKWVDQAVISAKVSEAGFIWRGPLTKKKNRKLKRNALGVTQVFLKTTDGELKFHPEWPALTKLNAVVAMDSSIVESTIYSGFVGDALVQETDLNINPHVSEFPYLSISGAIESDFGVAVDLLRKSPLKSRVIGLKDWNLSGKTDISLDLNIPLSSHKAYSSHNVDMTINSGLMSLIETDIFLEKLNGVLSYRDARGLFSNSLTGYFFNETFDSTLVTHDGSLLIDMNGQISMPSLANFINLKSDQIFKGRTNFIASINVPLKNPSFPIELDVNTDMKGAEINLPAPFGKKSGIKKDVSVNVIFDQRTNLIINFGEDIKSYLELEKKLIVNGVLSIESDRSELPGENQFLIEGHLKAADLLQWKNLYPKLFNSDDSKNSHLTPIFDIVIDKIEYAGLSIDAVGVSGGYQNGDWMLGIESEKLEGHLWIPSDSSLPILVDLERLLLQAPSEKTITKYSIHPSELPHLQLSVRNFTIGDKKFGESKLLMVPQDNGVKITDINANLLGLSIGDKEIKTTIEWIVDQNRHYTVFNGLLSVQDIGETMKSWNYPKIMDSKKAQFLSKLSWEGKPWEVSPESINGTVAINLKDGHFYQESSGTANALARLVSLFNFDNWVRRLQLDFSDIYEKGMSYNEMSGGLVFEMGQFTFDPPIKVDLPSGNIQLDGSANLISEDIKANLTTMLPVSNNLPWVAAAIGGLPVAAGVFITSKVFEKQVDKLSSITYSINGSWGSPKVVMEKIFNINTAGQKKSKNEDDISESEPKVR